MRRLTLILALAATTPLGACKPAGEATQQASSTVRIGGSFNLVDTQGAPVTEKALLGKPTAIFFGFTYCPEVCPTTLAELTAALKAMGSDADKLNVVFVSVDPERDTPEQMKLYLSNFDPRIQGFTGTPEQVAAITKAYRVYYQKVPLDGGSYTVDHSSAVYLLDRKGEFDGVIAYKTPPDEVASRLRKLLGRA